ncbi:hypothetical protein ACSFBI_26175 [Variovorax sp. RB3P1]|uniref:hypothetical protein n=1 Tax=Variovorax sp. RB3P1 TaxID=3443732 RepID=UPI003F44BA54
MRTREPRQLNVQQQNARVERSLRAEALYWREHGVPEALLRCAKERGIRWEMSIVIDLDTDCPGSLSGILISQDARFIEFDIDTDTDGDGDVQVHRWTDVTSMQNVNEHNAGTGVGRGALALRVLRELTT